MGFIDAAMDALLRRKPRPFSTMGTSGTFTIGGFLYTPEKNPLLSTPTQRYREFDRIKLNVGVVATGLRYFAALIAGVDWTFEAPEDGGKEAEHIAEVLEKMTNSMDTPFYRVVRRMAQFKWDGCSVQEWTAARMDEVEPGFIGIGTVENRPQITLEQWDLEPQSGEVVGWLQRDQNTGETWPLARGKCIYIFDDTLTDMPDGVGLMRHVVQLCQELRQLERLEGYSFETDLRGTPVGYAPTGVLDDMVTKGQLTQVQATSMLKGMKDFIQKHVKDPSLGIMLDSGVYYGQGPGVKTPSPNKMWSIDLLKGNGQGLAELGQAIERKQREIARILGIEQFMLGADKGSHALSADKTANLVQLISSCLTEIAWTLEHDFLDPVFALNNWDPKLKPKMKPDPVHLRSVGEICTNLLAMAQAGATILPNDPVINQVRGMMDLMEQPEVDPEVAGILQGTALPKDPNADPNAPPGKGAKPGDKPGDKGDKTKTQQGKDDLKQPTKKEA